MPSPAGTIAIVAAISLAVQCVIWLICFLLYILAYTCVLTFTTPTNISEAINNLLLLYLQGVSCQKPGLPRETCFKNAVPSTVLLGIFIIGAILNLILMIVCFMLLSAFWKHPVAKQSLMKMFVTSIFLVSIWDIVLTAVVSFDYSQLPDQCPGDPLITIFMSACRGGFLLVSNTAFAIYLLINICKTPVHSKTNGLNISSSEIERKRKIEENLKHWLQEEESEKNYQQPPPHTAAARFSIPPRSTPEDQVIHSRWTEYRGEVAEDTTTMASVATSSVSGWERSDEGMGELIVPEKPIWRVARDLRMSEQRHENPQDMYAQDTGLKLPNIQLRDSQQSAVQYPESALPPAHSPYISHREEPSPVRETWEDELTKKLNAMNRHDALKKQEQQPRAMDDPISASGHRSTEAANTSAYEKPHDELSRKIPPDAFSYGYGKTFFGVRLRPVRSPDNPPGNETNAAGEKQERRFEPRDPVPAHVKTPDSPLPPPQPPSSIYSNLPGSPTQPMSLQEAILTRRPLRPVNRPALDANQYKSNNGL